MDGLTVTGSCTIRRHIAFGPKKEALANSLARCVNEAAKGVIKSENEDPLVGRIFLSRDSEDTDLKNCLPKNTKTAHVH